MMSAMTPHGDSSTLSRVSNQESFLKTGPKYESTPRDVPKTTLIEASLVGAPGGAVISEAKLIQQVLFIIQDIPSNLIKYAFILFQKILFKELSKSFKQSK